MATAFTSNRAATPSTKLLPPSLLLQLQRYSPETERNDRTPRPHIITVVSGSTYHHCGVCVHISPLWCLDPHITSVVSGSTYHHCGVWIHISSLWCLDPHITSVVSVSTYHHCGVWVHRHLQSGPDRISLTVARRQK